MLNNIKWPSLLIRLRVKKDKDVLNTSTQFLRSSFYQKKIEKQNNFIVLVEHNNLQILYVGLVFIAIE